MVYHAFIEGHEGPNHDSTGIMGSSILLLVQEIRDMIFGVATTREKLKH